jgi:hypothetical protein
MKRHANHPVPQNVKDSIAQPAEDQNNYSATQMCNPGQQIQHSSYYRLPSSFHLLPPQDIPKP